MVQEQMLAFVPAVQAYPVAFYEEADADVDLKIFLRPHRSETYAFKVFERRRQKHITGIAEDYRLMVVYPVRESRPRAHESILPMDLGTGSQNIIHRKDIEPP